MKYLYYISLLFVAILLSDCAQIAAPTGGDPDTKPPALDSLGTIPLNYSTNFKGDQIVMTFNEYFVLKNPTANVFFSPSLENEPEFITKGKTLTVLLNNKLKENTTYTINFGDAISDYTVGNKIPDFKYVFSTGDFIDSMKTSGKVVDAFTGKPVKEVTVMLYEDFDDSIVSKNKPVYYATTNKEGQYSLSFLKAGTYKLFALKDENRNFLYDLPNEAVGETDSLITLLTDTVISNNIVPIYVKDYKKQGIKSKKYLYPGKLVITFVKPAEEIVILKSDSTKLRYSYFDLNEEKDSLIIWQPDLDSGKNELLIQLDTTKLSASIYPFRVPKKPRVVSSSKVSKSIDENAPFSIYFTRPIDHTDNPEIAITQDSTFIAIDSFSIKKNQLLVYFAKKADASYKYQLFPGAITDIFNTKITDTISGFVTVREKDFYGSFTLNLNPTNDSANYIVSIMDSKGILVEKQIASGVSDITFAKLPPGKYKIKAIEDGNKNGIWDTGNYYLKQKPERVFYFSNEIEIRSNWEMAESWGI